MSCGGYKPGCSSAYGDEYVIQGPMGPQGMPGPMGPQGPRGERGAQGVRGEKGETGCPGPIGPRGMMGMQGPRGPQGPQGDKGCPGSQGEQGPQGERGERGERGETGPQGPMGATPTVEIGTVAAGESAKVTANATETGVALDFVLPAGPAGAQGLQGEKGETGERGETGPAPAIEVAANTETVYKLRFLTEGQEVESPNLRGVPAAYNADLSQTGSSMEIPLGPLTLTASRASSDSIRLAVAPAITGTSVQADIRRVSIYDGGTFDIQTNDNTAISSRLVLDDILYNRSREMHWMTFRMQDPTTSLWSVCSVRTFCSTTTSSRTTVWVEWICTGVSYQS